MGACDDDDVTAVKLVENDEVDVVLDVTIPVVEVFGVDDSAVEVFDVSVSVPAVETVPETVAVDETIVVVFEAWLKDVLFEL